MRQIGCLDTGSWVKIIGIFQLISCALFVISLSVMLHGWIA
ncbi:unnamed protein product, partial [Allacma fusca]